MPVRSSIDRPPTRGRAGVSRGIRVVAASPSSGGHRPWTARPGHGGTSSARRAHAWLKSRLLVEMERCRPGATSRSCTRRRNRHGRAEARLLTACSAPRSAAPADRRRRSSPGDASSRRSSASADAGRGAARRHARADPASLLLPEIAERPPGRCSSWSPGRRRSSSRRVADGRVVDEIRLSRCRRRQRPFGRRRRRAPLSRSRALVLACEQSGRRARRLFEPAPAPAQADHRASRRATPAGARPFFCRHPRFTTLTERAGRAHFPVVVGCLRCSEIARGTAAP
jgi:hypothetical protein